jgi:hypothetical protein
MALTCLVLAATVLHAGCAPATTKPKPIVDEQANFAEFKTFSLRTSGNNTDAEPMSLEESRIREAITKEMRRKGYDEAPAGSSGDILIDYKAARTEKMKSNPVRVGIGIGSFGSGVGGSVSTSTSGVKNISEGSLVINAVDSARNAEVWRSQISRELGKDAVTQDAVESVVSEVLIDFPARTTAP